MMGNPTSFLHPVVFFFAAAVSCIFWVYTSLRKMFVVVSGSENYSFELLFQQHVSSRKKCYFLGRKLKPGIFGV